MAESLGDARVTTETEILARSSKKEGPGIYLGRFFDTEKGEATVEVPYSRDRHLLLFGPTGSGKSRRFLLPNLLLGLEEQSVIVIDPKGELAAMTADHRRSIGHEVLILNPFNVLGLDSAGFNPLATLDADSDTFYDDASAIGEALIKIEGNEPHWSESAQGLMVGLIMWEKQQRREQASLENVRAMLTEPNEWLAEGRGSESRLVKGLPVTAAKMVAAGSEEIASLAARFTGYTDELRSIQSTADTQTRWLLSRPMKDDLKKDGVRFGDLKKKPMTVYVVLPAERLRTHSVWLRLVIVSALRSLYKPGGRRTLLLVDEMASLGQLGPLEDAFGLICQWRLNPPQNGRSKFPHFGPSKIPQLSRPAARRGAITQRRASPPSAPARFNGAL